MKLPPNPNLKAECEAAKLEWEKTLAHFKQPRPLIVREHYAIERAVAQQGFDAVRQALIGARHEPKTENFDPADYVNLDRIFMHKNFLRFVGLGAKEEAKIRARRVRAAMDPGTQDTTVVTHVEDKRIVAQEEFPSPDPERVRQVIAQAFSKSPLKDSLKSTQCEHHKAEMTSNDLTQVGGTRFRVKRFKCPDCDRAFSRTEKLI